MPKLHIVYDPTDEMQMGVGEANIAWMKKKGIKTAVMSVSAELSNNEIEQVVGELGTLLLEQVRMDGPA